jgi:uncharacterized membrane protein HdeD (DUF308 family)
MPEQSISDAIKDKWMWFLILGVALVICGVFAIAMPLASGLAISLVVGLALMAGGIAQVLHSFSVSSWGGFMWQLLIGLVAVAGGYIIFSNPLAGIVAITIVIGWVFVAQGISQAILAFRLRPRDGWVWILVSGIVSLVVGVLVLNRLPLSVVGILAGISIAMNGFGYIFIAMAARRVAGAMDTVRG